MNGVIDALRKFQLAQAAAFRRASEVLGVSETALSALRSLLGSEEQAGLPMKDLAHEVGVSPAVMTGIVDRLEEKGWARRHLSPSDRRSTLVVPTVSETDPVSRVMSDLEDPLRRVANSVSPDAAAVVRRLAAAMEAELRAFHPEPAD